MTLRGTAVRPRTLRCPRDLAEGLRTITADIASGNRLDKVGPAPDAT
jgi:hypothetical protein